MLNIDFLKKIGEVLFYSNFRDNNAMFISDGCDEPLFPLIIFQFERKMNKLEKELIIKTIKKLELKLKNDKA